MKEKNVKGETLHWQQKIIFCLMFFGATIVTFAQHTIKGKVTDDKAIPLAGVNIIVKGSSNTTVTDFDGNYTINNIKTGSYKILFTYISFENREVNVTVPRNGALNITLKEESNNLNEVIVTGVFDKRKRLDASVAISTISAAEIKQQASGSAADLLKNVPGVYVNSSAGEIRNQVVVRGTPTSNDLGKGFYYVSMQEDGLPVTNLTGYNFGPDYFLRSDINTARVEAVRGGSSSITGSDAPGGLFNYTSKSGSKEFEGEVRLKSGIEGNGNPFKRIDAGVGGALNKKGDITYYIGGFYRESDGARNPGYTLNKGGQLKANIKKVTEKGYIKLYAKYLNDKNGTFDFLPYTNFDNPTVASGFKNTDTFVGGNVNFDFNYSNGGPTQNFNAKNLITNKDKAIGVEFNHNFDNGWTITNNFKYSSKDSQWNAQLPLGILSANSFTFYSFTGMLFSPNKGVLNVTDLTTGQNMLSVRQDGPFSFTTLSNNLPNSNIQAAPVILTLANALDSKVNEIMEQFIVNKKVGKTTFTAGGYFGSSKVNVESGYASQSYVTLQNRPHALGITYTNDNGNITQYTDSHGNINYGVGYKANELTNTRLDLFFAQTSPIGNRLTLDYGIRYNYNKYKGQTVGQVLNTAITNSGGTDGNPLTLYDNTVYNLSDPWTYNKKFNSVSFSGALNYKISDNQAVYGRYSMGSKAPDMAAVVGPETKEAADLLKLEPIHMKQAEIGYKAQMNNFTAYVTPFYSEVSNMPNSVYGNDPTTASGHYYTPIVFSTQQTIGLEIETKINITPQFKIRAVGTMQDPKSIVSRTWDLKADGIADDEVIEIRNAAIQLTPKLLGSLTPSYNIGAFDAFITWQYTGTAPANSNRAFYMPAYDQVDLGFGYAFTKKLDFRFNMNNVFNTLGVTGWYPPGGFPDSLFADNFTKEKLEANPNAVWGARTTLPRSMYFTLTYKF